MGHIFGKPKSKKLPPQALVTEQDKAILQLKQQRDKLKQYQKRINIQLGKEREIARELMKNDKKEKALLLLRKKKYMEKILEQSDNQLMNLEQMVADIEFAQIEANVVSGLQIGNEALKQLHEVLSIDQIENILGDTRESIAKQNEIDELIRGAIVDENEDELLQELETMVQEEVPKENLPAMPDVPQTEPSEINKVPVTKKTKEMVAA